MLINRLAEQTRVIFYGLICYGNNAQQTPNQLAETVENSPAEMSEVILNRNDSLEFSRVREKLLFF